MKPYENQMPAGVDSFVEEASKEEVKAPSNVEKEYKNLSGEAVKAHLSGQKLSPEKQTRYDQVKGEMSKLAKVPVDKGGLKQPKQSPEQKLMGVKSVRDAVIDDTLKDTKVNKDIVKKAADAEFNQEKPIGTLNKEKGYYEYDKPFLKADIKSDADMIAEHTNKTQPSNVVTYGNSSKFLEKYGLDKYFEFDGADLVDKRDYSTTPINFGKGMSEENLLNEIKKYYPNLSKKEQPEVDEDMERAYGPMYDEETGELNPAYRRREEDISDENEEEVYPKGTSKAYTEKVNDAYEKALPILEKAGIKLEEFGGHSNDRGGYEDNTKELMDKYVFRPFREKYPNGNNDAWNREYKELYEAIDAVLDKKYNDWWIKNK